MRIVDLEKLGLVGWECVMAPTRHPLEQAVLVVLLHQLTHIREQLVLLLMAPLAEVLCGEILGEHPVDVLGHGPHDATDPRQLVVAVLASASPHIF